MKRRDVLKGTAAGTILAVTPASAVSASADAVLVKNPDAKLVALAAEYDELCRAYNAVCEVGNPPEHERKAYVAAEDAIFQEMFSRQAIAPKGLWAKMRVTFGDRLLGGGPDFPSDFDFQENCLASVYRDLERLAGEVRS